MSCLQAWQKETTIDEQERRDRQVQEVIDIDTQNMLYELSQKKCMQEHGRSEIGNRYFCEMLLVSPRLDISCIMCAVCGRNLISMNRRRVVEWQNELH